MRIVIAGATGFIGRRFVQQASKRGDAVVVLSRSTSGSAVDALVGLPGVTVRAWKASAERQEWWSDVDGADAVVNLAGESVMSKRWDPQHKARVLDSRVNGSRACVAAIGAAHVRPKVFVSASAVGFYGTACGERTIDESSPPGSDFLAHVCVRWEQEAAAVDAFHVRAVQLRIGIVLGEGGGALDQMVPAFKLFAGGPVGAGSQWMPWIHCDDVVGLLFKSIDDASLSGPVNAIAPGLVRNAEFSKALGRVLKRPSWLPVPALALRMLFGEAADVILTGQHALPKKALAAGYAFKFPTIDQALRATFGGVTTPA